MVVVVGGHAPPAATQVGLHAGGPVVGSRFGVVVGPPSHKGSSGGQGVGSIVVVEVGSNVVVGSGVVVVVVVQSGT